jgi:hypothetical protein
MSSLLVSKLARSPHLAVASTDETSLRFRKNAKCLLEETFWTSRFCDLSGWLSELFSHRDGIALSIRELSALVPA